MKHFLFLLLLLLTSCTRTLTTTQQTTQQTAHQRDTLTHHDTLHRALRDTIHQRDTILLKTYPSSDTIIRQLIIHRNAVRLLHDTVRLATHQTAAHDSILQSTQTLTQTSSTHPTAPRPSLLSRIALIAWLLVILTLFYILTSKRVNK